METTWDKVDKSERLGKVRIEVNKTSIECIPRYLPYVPVIDFESRVKNCLPLPR